MKNNLVKRVERLEEHVIRPGDLHNADHVIAVLQAMDKLPTATVEEIIAEVRQRRGYIVSRELVEKMLAIKARRRRERDA